MGNLRRYTELFTCICDSYWFVFHLIYSQHQLQVMLTSYVWGSHLILLVTVHLFLCSVPSSLSHVRKVEENDDNNNNNNIDNDDDDSNNNTGLQEKKT